MFAAGHYIQVRASKGIYARCLLNIAIEVIQIHNLYQLQLIPPGKVLSRQTLCNGVDVPTQYLSAERCLLLCQSVCPEDVC